MGLTEARDLRSGDVPWDDDGWSFPPSDPTPTELCDVAIIGGGVMGSIVAERLSADGLGVVVLDRRQPGLGSTAASTAELMWAMDVPLGELAAMISEAEAGRRWQRVYRAVRGLADRIDRLGIDCHRRDRPTVYLEGNTLDAKGLRAECALHRKFDLPSTFLDSAETHRRFGIQDKAAIVSDGGFEVDPVRLANGMLELARKRGAHVCYPVDVTSLHEDGEGVTLTLSDGTPVRTRRVVLAGGYERAPLFLPAAFSLLSTFVMASPPGTAPLWREKAMIWEASDPYLYIRVDAEGRVLAGGEDEEFEDPFRRDAMIQAKAGTIAAKTGSLLGRDPLVIDKAWAATFGASPDGLPAIGRAANMDGVWLSAGFGGNGIAFAALAAEILAAEFSGAHDPDADCFDPYRFGAT